MTTIEAAEAAREAGLRYAHDDRPGVRRRRAGRGFRYVDSSGRPVSNAADIERIRRLAIPPAWTDVWICPDPRGHIQATGRDARGRKQYRYHDRWRDTRDEAKYARLADFARALPGIRARIAADLAKPGLPREKVTACVVRLLETTLIRVGNEEYAQENRSFGLTTLRRRHVSVSGTRIVFRFRGKGGVTHEVRVIDRRLARVVRGCQDLPGQELFQYQDGELGAVTSDDVNAYLREISGRDFTAKDFRTWAGTLLAARALCACAPAESETAAKKSVVRAVEEVARQLRNTRAVCRTSYIHPAVIDAYVEGALRRLPRRRTISSQARSARLTAEESAVLRLLERRARASRRAARAA